MKVFSLIVVPGVLALAISVAKADPSPNPATSGAQTMPSGAEPDSPPPATYDPGTPGIAPATAIPTAKTPTVPAVPSAADVPAAAPSPSDSAAPAASGPAATAPAAAPPPTTFDETNPAVPPAGAPATPTQTNTGATNIVILPPPPNGQTTESAPVQPLPPVQVGPEGAYPGAAVYSHVGVALLVGGGFQDFTNGHIKNVTGDGGYWTARIVAGTRQYVGMEAAYVGDARSISGLGFSTSSMLISNGLQGNLRLNLPIVRGMSLIEPFGFIGVGWSHYTVTSNNAVVSDVTSRDDILTVPYGGGLQYSYRGFMADARFTYTQTYYNNLTQTIGGNLNTWGVGGQIGFEY